MKMLMVHKWYLWYHIRSGISSQILKKSNFSWHNQRKSNYLGHCLLCYLAQNFAKITGYKNLYLNLIVFSGLCLSAYLHVYVSACLCACLRVYLSLVINWRATLQKSLTGILNIPLYYWNLAYTYVLLAADNTIKTIKIVICKSYWCNFIKNLWINDQAKTFVF